MKTKPTLHLISLALVGITSLTGVAPVQADEASRAVVKAIAARDCAGAIKELNNGMAAGSVDAILTGGAMFEQGLCLKPNVERAANLYKRAANAGAGGAAARLVALYASPAAGPDKGAAIWWALDAGLTLPEACTVPTALRGDAEAFAKVLTAWPAGVLDACVQVAGAVSVVSAEFVTKPLGAAGGVVVDFRPSADQINVGTDALTTSIRDSSARVTEVHSINSILQSGSAPSLEQLQAQKDQAALQDLSGQVDAVARSALQRFPKTQATPADWRVQMRVLEARPR